MTSERLLYFSNAPGCLPGNALPPRLKKRNGSQTSRSDLPRHQHSNSAQSSPARDPALDNQPPSPAPGDRFRNGGPAGIQAATAEGSRLPVEATGRTEVLRKGPPTRS